MKSNSIIRYFPFSPGVPWELKNGKYIVPALNGAIWDRVTDNKSLALVGYGGLFESYFGLSILELLNRSNPSTVLHWSGDDRFNYLVHRNGLAKVKPTIKESVLKEYPVPLFFDKNSEVAYINYLNNYLDVKTYNQKFGYHDRRPVFQQIFGNSLTNWDLEYLPKFRNIDTSPEFKSWCNHEKMHLDRNYVLLLPDVSSHSKHSNVCINWESAQIKSFAAMLSQERIELIIATPFPERYYGSRLHVLPNKFEFLFPVLESANVVISKDIDFLLIAMLMENKIISNIQKGEFDLIKNRKYLFGDEGPDIFLDKEVSPYQAFMEIKKI